MGRDVYCYILILYKIKLLKMNICCLYLPKINFKDGSHSSFKNV